jgi:hypothetical protein
VRHQTRKGHKSDDDLVFFFKWIDLHTPSDLEFHAVSGLDRHGTIVHLVSV